jgi:hypothetical protein
MQLSITRAVTAQEKEELLTGLRAYNAQFLDLRPLAGILAFTCGTIKASCSAG